jgi:hypothetical protein
MPDHRQSFWTRTFDAARVSGEWHLVNRHYTPATAVQITSDICCAHTRDPGRHRMRGMLPGERWEARWEPAEDGAPSDLVIWIRLAPHSEATSMARLPDHHG